MKLTTFIFLFALITNWSYAQYASKRVNTFNKVENSISVSIDGASNLLAKNALPNASLVEVEISTIPYNYIGVLPDWKVQKERISNNKIVWTLQSDEEVMVFSPVWGYFMLLSPGDNVSIDSKEGHLKFTGAGAEKLKMQFEIESIQKRTPPTKNPFRILSLDDYLNWLKFLEQQLEAVLSKLNEYKNTIRSPKAYAQLRLVQLLRIEVARTSAFNGLLTYATKTNFTEIDKAKLIELWDNTQKNTTWGKWLRSQTEFCGDVYYFYDYNRMQLRRDYNFVLTEDAITQKKRRVETYYRLAKEQFSGLLRERLLQYIVANEIITELGPADEFSQAILTDYFKEVKLPQYEKWMKSFYKSTLTLSPGKRVPYFSLTDDKGSAFTKDNIKGKIVLLDFWHTGSTDCMEMSPALKQVKEKFAADTNVLFINVSIDKDFDIWQNSIKAAKYCSQASVNVYTGGLGSDHAMIKRFNVVDYPQLILLNDKGRILSNPVPDPRTDSGKEQLINIIKSEADKLSHAQYTATNDGPYVLYNNGSPISYFIENNHLSSKAGVKSFDVNTDQTGKTFSVQLKQTIKYEPAEFKTSGKILAISDIEGNFNAFRKLLQQNKVIDSNYKWIFGNGHLVFAGDMFDRGLQVTECLWLTYSLEDQARAAGGYVHFILGNHEIMNLQGNHLYTQPKYLQNAAMIGKTIAQLYNEESELGKWLRSKNIIEKINDLLFVHGGISPEVNRMNLTLSKLNSLAQRYYSGNLDSTNQHLLTIFNDKRQDEKDRSSPFWFRGYYGDRDNVSHIPALSQIDSTLALYNVNHIVTGHTIVADTISLWYGNKVINIDTRHASGKSEALLVDKDSFHRLTIAGEKKPLFNSALIAIH